MAIKRLTIDGYGQLELNQVAFRRDGRVEAQCKMADTVDFLENGMLVAVDYTKREVKMPEMGDAMIALNYTTEHMYDPAHSALKDFRLAKDSFLPRLGYLAKGDRFTTNCIAYDGEEFSGDTATAEAALKDAVAACAETAVYGCECENGAIKVTATKPDSAVVKLLVEKATTMPDGQYAIKFVVME